MDSHTASHDQHFPQKKKNVDHHNVVENLRFVDKNVSARRRMAVWWQGNGMKEQSRHWRQS